MEDCPKKVFLMVLVVWDDKIATKYPNCNLMKLQTS